MLKTMSTSIIPHQGVAVKIEITVKMTAEQARSWADYEDCSEAELGQDIASYIEHNLLRPSTAAEDWQDVKARHVTTTAQE